MTSEVCKKNYELFLRSNPGFNFVLDLIKTQNWEWCETAKGEKNLQRNLSGHTFFLHPQSGAVEEIQKWWSMTQHSNTKVIIIYGLGLGYHYTVLKEWLHADPARFLVLLEDDVEIIKHFFSLEQAHEVLDDPQVIVRFFFLPKEDYFLFRQQFDSILLSIIHHNPSFFALGSYSLYRAPMFKILNQMVALAWGELKMTYGAILTFSFSEEFMNIYQNMPYTHESYRLEKLKGLFKDLPIIICGAGPSLETSIPIIEKLEDRALIVAGGSSVNALSSHGIIPHFGGGVDPTVSQRSRFMSNFAYMLPILYMPRFNYQAFQVIKGPKLIAKGVIGFPASEWFEKKLGYYGEPYSTQFGISTPTFLTSRMGEVFGSNRFILAGMDLSYPDQRRYASGIQAHPTDIFAEKELIHQTASKTVQAKNSLGQPVMTTMQMKFEASFYSDFIRLHPEISLINTTLNGLEIFKVPHESLENLTFEDAFDINGRVHAAIQNAKLDLTYPDVKVVLEEWKASFDECKTICEDLGTKLKTLPIDEYEKENSLSKALEGKVAYDMVMKKYLEILSSDFLLDMYQLVCHPEKFSKEELDAKKKHKHSTELDFLRLAAKWHSDQVIIGIDNYEDYQRQLLAFKRKSPLTPPERRPLPHSEPDVASSGSLTEQVERVDGKREGISRLYYPSGKLFGETQYAKGVMHGSSKFYDERKNLLSETTFVNGKREGDVYLYYPSGEVYAIERFQKGKRHGIHEYYYPTGIMKALITYSEGILDGKVRIFHENGANERELTFKNGKLNGYEYGWSATEKLLHQSEYSLGTPINQSKVWNKDGKLILRYDYVADTGKCSSFEWDLNGKLIRQDIYVPDNALEEVMHKSKGISESVAQLKAQIERLKKESQQ